MLPLLCRQRQVWAVKGYSHDTWIQATYNDPETQQMAVIYLSCGMPAVSLKPAKALIATDSGNCTLNSPHLYTYILFYILYLFYVFDLEVTGHESMHVSLSTVNHVGA
jgi:hypothetical protein